MWKFLIISGIVELSLLTPVLLLFAALGYHGYRTGEMGAMVGIFSGAILLFLFPYILIKALTVHGLRKRKPWSAWSVIFLSLILPVGWGG